MADFVVLLMLYRIVEGGHDELVKEAIKVAEKISSKGRIAVKAAKEAINSCQSQSDCTLSLIGCHNNFSTW